MKKIIFVLGIALCSLSSFAAKKDVKKTSMKNKMLDCCVFVSSCGTWGSACAGYGQSMESAIFIADFNECPFSYLEFC